MNNLKYVTYQSFPANTANSIQTISNIVHLVKNQTSVDLYFPLRENQSSDNLIELQKFYNFASNQIPSTSKWKPKEFFENNL